MNIKIKGTKSFKESIKRFLKEHKITSIDKVEVIIKNNCIAIIAYTESLIHTFSITSTVTIHTVEWSEQVKKELGEDCPYL